MDSDDQKAGMEPTTMHVRRAIDGDRTSLEWLVTRLSPYLRAQASYRLGPAMSRRLPC